MVSSEQTWVIKLTIVLATRREGVHDRPRQSTD